MREPASAHPRILAAATLALWNLAFAISHRAGIWLSIGLAALALDALCLWLDPSLRRPRFPSARLLVLGALAAIVQIAATYLLYPLAVQAWPGLAPRVAGLYLLLGTSSSALLLAPTAFVAASEELVFRGALQGWLARHGPAWASIFVSALVYALGHVASGELVLVFLAFACGAAWGALRAASGSLVPGLIAHLCWNLAVMFLHPLAP